LLLNPEEPIAIFDSGHGWEANMAADPEEGKSAVRLQWFKEVVTAVLGIGIVVYTLVMTGLAFGMVGDASRMADAKDLLTFLSGFAGVVVGYYFGRVPADARTAQAQQQIGQAVSEKEQTMSKMDDMKKELADLEDKMESGEDLRPADVRHVREMA
jgi:hypothetical protein